METAFRDHAQLIFDGPMRSIIPEEITVENIICDVLFVTSPGEGNR